jgi:hypothetical protein
VLRRWNYSQHEIFRFNGLKYNLRRWTMNRALVRLLTVLAFGASVALVGCEGGGIERVDVSGTVTYQGNPVEKGLITFEPQEKGPVAGTSIKDGKYEAKGRGGVPPGKYYVKISSSVNDEGTYDEAMGPEPPRKEILPEKYNVATELTLEVPSGQGSLEKNFDLE